MHANFSHFISDNWTSECIHPAKIAGGIPRSLHCHGANGRQFVPGDFEYNFEFVQAKPSKY